MPRRLTPSQFAAEVRRRQASAKAAVDKYNREAQAHNRKVVAVVNRAIDKSNRDVRAHNAEVRRNRQRRQAELSRLRTAFHRSSTAIRSSNSRLQGSFDALESSGGEHRLRNDLFDLSEGEAANSAATVNALLGEPPTTPTEPEIDDLKQTTIRAELLSVDPDLDRRWKGALYALDPNNPDAARHFCTSAREMLSGLLERAAPDDAVIATNIDYVRTPNGTVSRRARIQYCLAANDTPDDIFVDFVEEDVDDVIALFDEFNSATHGAAGRFGINHLRALKLRVEDAIKFIHRIALPRLN